VFAITAGAFVPLNFLAVRLAEPLIHPRVFGAADSGMEGSMWLTFLVCLVGMALLFAVLWKYEMTSKNAAQQLRALRRRLADEAEARERRSAAPATTS